MTAPATETQVWRSPFAADARVTITLNQPRANAKKVDGHRWQLEVDGWTTSEPGIKVTENPDYGPRGYQLIHERSGLRLSWVLGGFRTVQEAREWVTLYVKGTYDWTLSQAEILKLPLRGFVLWNATGRGTVVRRRGD